MSKSWHEVAGIEKPDFKSVSGHREANTFARLILALLERGEAMTLDQVAQRWEDVGLASFERARLSLQRCKPARPPIYREDDSYFLDPFDSELRHWLFRLDLLENKFTREPCVEPAPQPLPDSSVALTTAELAEAWKDAYLSNWSDRRLTLAILDAHAEPVAPTAVVEKLSELSLWHPMKKPPVAPKGAPFELLTDGRLALTADSEDDLRKVRDVVREQLRVVRKYAARLPSPQEMEKLRATEELEEERRRQEFQKMRRAIVVTFPPERPVAATLLDIGAHTIATFIGPELDDLCVELEDYQYIGAVNVRGVLRALGFEPGARRLAELGPPQKTLQLNKAGRTLKITNTLLAQGSCGIDKPFGDIDTMKGYVLKGNMTKLAQRLESDAKSLYALYEYGRLHGWVRLRLGFLDEDLLAPWVDSLEARLWHLKIEALERQIPLEVVLGNAPDWSDPWALSIPAIAYQDVPYGEIILLDEDGYRIAEAEIQRARFLLA